MKSDLCTKIRHIALTNLLPSFSALCTIMAVPDCCNLKVFLHFTQIVFPASPNQNIVHHQAQSHSFQYSTMVFSLSPVQILPLFHQHPMHLFYLACWPKAAKVHYSEESEMEIDRSTVGSIIGSIL